MLASGDWERTHGDFELRVERVEESEEEEGETRRVADQRKVWLLARVVLQNEDRKETYTSVYMCIYNHTCT